jgi:hypothetical protein
VILSPPSDPLEIIEPQGESITLDVLGKFLIIPTGASAVLPLYNEFLNGRTLLTAGNKTFTNNTDTNTGIQNMLKSWFAIVDAPRVDVMPDLTGQANGAVTAGALAPDSLGNPYGALRLNGSTSQVNLGHPAAFNLGTGSFSICWRAKYPQTQSADYSAIISKGFRSGAQNVNSFGITTYGTSTDSLRYYEIGTAGSFATALTLEINIPDGWHNFVFIRDVTADKIFLYDNGSKVYEGAYTADVNLTSVYDLTVGRSSLESSYIGCDITDIRVYTRALTPEEAAAYNSFNNISSTGLAAALTPYQPSGFIDFFLLTNRPTALSCVVDSANNINQVTVSLGNGSVYYGRYFCPNLLLDTDTDNIPDWLDKNTSGSLSNLLEGYGPI